jgi:hypothetical protein
MKNLIEINDIENDSLEHNQISVDALFEMYTAQNFIYPQKQERLKPVLNIVRDNWRKAMKLNFPLFWVSTISENSSNITATSSAWQYLNKGMIGQHLTSNHPVGSRIILLGMIKKLIQNHHKEFLESFQIFYRPENKYPSRVFESVSQKAGESLSRIIPYNYFEVPFIKQQRQGAMDIIEINNYYHPGFLNFIKKQRGEFFINAQELNSKDIKLEGLNSRFEPYGLNRGRRIFAAVSSRDHHIYGVIIINQSSLGLNFSFFENSCELICCRDAGEKDLLVAAGGLLHKAAELAGYPALNYIPVLVDPVHAPIITQLRGKLTKNYNLFIILKEGYETWYDHVAQLTNNVFQRFINNTYANTVTQ